MLSGAKKKPIFSLLERTSTVEIFHFETSYVWACMV